MIAGAMSGISGRVESKERRAVRSEGGAGGKAPNKAGTQPTGRIRQKPGKPGRKKIKGGAGLSAAKSKYATKRSAGVRTSETRKAGPKKIPARTTTRSGDK